MGGWVRGARACGEAGGRRGLARRHLQLPLHESMTKLSCPCDYHSPLSYPHHPHTHLNATVGRAAREACAGSG